MYLLGIAYVSVLQRVLGLWQWTPREGPVLAGQGVSGKAFCVSSETGQLNRDKGCIREGK